MSEILWIVFSVFGIVLALLAVFIWKLRKNEWQHRTDYKVLYNMGIIWLPFGIIFMTVFESSIGSFFFILGLAYTIIGLANRDKWGKRVPVDPKQKKILACAVIAGVTALLAGVVAFLLLI